MNETTRPARSYTVHYRDDVDGSAVIGVAPGTKDAQDKAAWNLAENVTATWVRRGNWDDDGAAVECWYYIEDDESTWENQERHMTVDIEPNHAALMEAAGADDECERDLHPGPQRNSGEHDTVEYQVSA